MNRLSFVFSIGLTLMVAVALAADAGPATRPSADQTSEAVLHKKVTLAAPYPHPEPKAPKGKLTLQFAVGELGRQVGLKYNYTASFDNTYPTCVKLVSPAIHDMEYGKAMEGLLGPEGLAFEIHNNAVTLMKSKAAK